MSPCVWDAGHLKLGLRGSVPAGTDLTTKPWVQEAGVEEAYVDNAMKRISPDLPG